MTNPQAIGITPPSEAYQEATCSLVYRLSELMFGSLLAAYSLGFVGAIAAHGSQLSAHGLWGILLLSVQYASISISFAYLTTSFYVTYHASILTMPQMAFAHLASDFTLAIVQAIFFGVSIIQPALFPILLGVNFYLSRQRKDKECAALAQHLFKEICNLRGRDNPDQFRLFDGELKKLLKPDKFPKLSSWAPIGPDIRNRGRIAFIVGIIVIVLYVLLEALSSILALQNSWWFGISWLEFKWILQQILITVEVVAATVIIKKVGSQVVRRHAPFLGFAIKNPYSRDPGDAARDQRHEPQSRERSMDEEFEDLQSDLIQVCKKLFRQIE